MKFHSFVNCAAGAAIVSIGRRLADLVAERVLRAVPAVWPC